MAFQVSPGVNFSETDLTAGAQQVSVSDAAFAGPFLWGPALDPQNISSEDDLRQTFGKPDDTIAPYWFSAQSFLAYSNLLHAVRAVSVNALNSTTTASTITGTVFANGVNFSSNAGFTTATLVIGQTVLVNAVSYTITAVTNSTAFATSPAPQVGVVNSAVTSFGLLIKNNDHYAASFAAGIANYGAWAAKWPGDLGNSLQVAVCAGDAAFSSTPSGNISLTAGSNVVTGTGTTFTVDLQVGGILIVGGQRLVVTTLTNATSLITLTTSTKTNTYATTTWSRNWQYYNLFDRAPGTSAFTSARGRSLDEMHVVVVDAGGKFTGVAGTVLERFPFLSKAVDNKDANGNPNYYVTVLNRQSQYIWWLAAPGSNNATYGTTAVGTTPFGIDTLPYTVTLLGGQTDNANVDDSALQLAYDIFKNADLVDVSLVICGPASTTLASYIIQNVCEVRQDCVAFVSPSKASVVNNAGSEVASIRTFRNSLPSSSYAFMDSGWKYQNDKYNDVFRWVPLNGDIAGIAARSDSIADPWYSPAGFTRGNVKNVTKLAWNPKQVDRDDLYKLGVNPVVQLAASGTVLYGDKTLLNRPSAFDRINVRRLFIILEKTIARLGRSQLFEFNDEFTRSQFRNTVEPYMRDVKTRRGVVDYRVICDSSNNTDDVISQNRFVGDIYVKPSQSINFIQLNFVAVRSGVSFQEVTGAL